MPQAKKYIHYTVNSKPTDSSQFLTNSLPNFRANDYK